LASEATKFGDMTKITAITPFKVIEGHRFPYQLKARMRLPMYQYFGESLVKCSLLIDGAYL